MKKTLFSLALALCALPLVLPACGGSEDKKDADAADVTTEEAAPAEDIVQEEPAAETADPEIEAVEEAAEAVDARPEDEGEGEGPFCAAVGSTASLGGTVGRGGSMLINASDTALDAKGDVAIALFDHDPTAGAPGMPVALTFVTAADLSTTTARATFCIQNIPPGTLWVVAVLDDNGSGVMSGPEVGDILLSPLPQVTLTAGQSKTDAVYILSARVGRIHGTLSVDDALRGSVSDLIGTLYIAVVDAPTTSGNLLGGNTYTAVDLSANGATFDYSTPVVNPPTGTGLAYLAVVFDVNVSGLAGGPQPGDLVNYDLAATIPVLPPSVAYTQSGIVEEVDTELIWEVTP